MSQPDLLSPIPVFDVQEKNSVLFPVLDHLNVLEPRKWPYQKLPMPCGDFMVSKECAGEIKRIKRKYIYDPEHPIHNDLKRSMFQDALYLQMKGLYENFKRNWLIIEVEEGVDAFDPTFTQETWYQIRIQLEYEYDTHVQFTRTTLETINFIYALWKQAKSDSKYLPPVNLNPKPKEIPDQQIYFLSSMPNTGDMRARLLLKELHNPIKALNWIVSPTFEIKGIGQVYLETNRTILTKVYGGK